MLRIDASQANFEWEKLPNGTYRAFATLGKVGLPLSYVQLDANGEICKRVESIREDELFNEESMATAWGLPVTLGHPTNGLFSLNKEGTQVGSLLQEFRRDDETGELILPIVLHDRRGIELLEAAIVSGQRAELSPGYTVDSIEPQEDGTYLQKGRRYDHLALIPPGHGRGQQAISIRIDSLSPGAAIAEAISDRILQEKTSIEGKNMGVDVTIRNDTGEQVIRDVDPLVAAELKRLVKEAERVDSLTVTLGEKQASIDRLEGENEGLKTRVSTLEGERVDDNKVAGLIQERLAVWGQVLPDLKRLDTSFVPDYSLSPDSIKKLYLSKLYPHLDTADKSPEYISGVWDSLASNEARRDSDRSQSSSFFGDIDSTLSQSGGQSQQTSMKKRAEAIAGGYYVK